MVLEGQCLKEKLVSVKLLYRPLFQWSILHVWKRRRTRREKSPQRTSQSKKNRSRIVGPLNQTCCQETVGSCTVFESLTPSRRGVLVISLESLWHRPERLNSIQSSCRNKSYGAFLLMMDMLQHLPYTYTHQWSWHCSESIECNCFQNWPLLRWQQGSCKYLLWWISLSKQPMIGACCLSFANFRTSATVCVAVKMLFESNFIDQLTWLALTRRRRISLDRMELGIPRRTALTTLNTVTTGSLHRTTTRSTWNRTRMSRLWNDRITTRFADFPPRDTKVVWIWVCGGTRCQRDWISPI